MDLDFSVFYNEHYSRVVGYLSTKVGNRQDAEDLASQVFIYCYQNWNKYDPSKASMQSWLYMIVRSRWKNYCRDRKQFDNIDDFAGILHEEGDFAEQAAELDHLRQQMAEALEQLSEQQRKIILLRYYRDMTDKEIAERLCLSPVNVRVIAHRALHKMESVLNGKISWGV